MEETSLLNFIKYCLGYVKLTRQRSFIAQSKLSVELPKYLFTLKDLLESDVNDNFGKLINLETFYSFDPKEITKEIKKQYEEEQSLAKRIEEIYNKGRNDPYTKQIVFNFGYYKIEIPFEEEVELRPDYFEEEVEKPSARIDRYPLFSLPINIEKVFEKGAGKYFIKPIDSEIQINISVLADILGEDLYYKLVEEFGRYELEGSLSLPVANMRIFNEIWDKIRAQLRLTDAKFDEHSFILDEIHIGVSPRVNYFIADDLQKLSKFKDDDFQETSLTSWVKDEDLSIESEIPSEGDLYFPFPYDRYQLKVLSVVNNKAAIVQGPPGTGKSQTISNLICHLSANGNKVLFVSQKDQALKVVKDMLKKLNIKYLFGYIPDVGSIQLSEEDRLDGIAPQLASLESYVEKLGYKIYPRRKYPLIVYKNNEKDIITDEEINSVAENKIKLKNLFIKAIETQRVFYNLHQELRGLKEYDFRISNLQRFQDIFSNDLRKKIKKLKNDIEQLDEVIRIYEKNKKKVEFDELFSTLRLKESKYSELLQRIINDVTQSGYDGHNQITRFINNTLRKWRLNKIYSDLPREFIDYINNYFKQDISKAQMIKVIDELLAYCRHYEQQQKLEELENELKNTLKVCGLSDEEFLQIEDLISKIGFDGVKEKILRTAEIYKELKKLKIENPNDLNLSLRETERTRQERVAAYLQNIINKKIIDKLKEGPSVKAIIRKLAKAFGKSKKAYKTFDRLREDPNNFLEIMDFVAVWIMELDDASRIIPLKPAIFDYVIFDESSQCNIAYAIPAMYRAKKALFVGDSEQMRDNTIIFKSNRSFDELAKKYQIPEDLQIKATGEAVQSILDVARLRGCEEIPLRNHYRSPKELIGFSNKYFYKPKGKELIILNSNYLAYKNTNRIMIIHPVKVDWDKEISDKISVSEAEEILRLFRELRSDKKYRDKSIGILSFFNAQAAYIRELFEKEGYKEEVDNYKIGIIEGIQGDEKDIIIYSFVIRTADQKNKYVPLTGEGGDIRADINKGRVNVAFSRARLQTHCFVSMPIEEIPGGIWIKKYLEYARDSGEIDFYSVKLKPFDSDFEKEFYDFIRSNLPRGYRVQNQVESCGFRIDFVISNTKSGKKIAIECDGPIHFSNEMDEEIGIYVEDDEERQRVLETAGWEFYRIKYSDWIDEKFDRNSILNDIIKILS
jgi:superfamily I DNA and/or RNA helicase/very-short-patch-repair endonuclease